MSFAERNTPRLVRVKDRDNWYIQYFDGQASRRISTKTDDKAEAKAVLANFTEDFKVNLGISEPTVEQLLETYVSDRVSIGKNRAPLQGRANRLRKFFVDTLASQVTRSMCRDFVTRQAQRNYSPKTVTDDLSLLRSALRFALGEGWVGRVPQMDFPPPPEPKDRWLTKAEAEALLMAIDAYHLKLFVRIALTTGARTSTILELRWEQVDLDDLKIDLNPPGRRQTNKRRPTVPINRALRRALLEARERATSDFVIEVGGGPIKRVSKGFRAATERVGLSDVTPHTLRHTAATWMAQGGVPIPEIAAMLGHKKVETTYRTYIKYTPDHLRKASNALELLTDLSLEPKQRPQKGGTSGQGGGQTLSLKLAKPKRRLVLRTSRQIANSTPVPPHRSLSRS